MTPENLMAEYERRLGTCDFDQVAPLIANDAIFWFTDGTHRGVGEIRKAFERTWSILKNETYWLDDMQWLAVGDDAAACTYRFNWRAEINGAPAQGNGRGTTVLQRDGDWRIVHEHLSRATG